MSVKQGGTYRKRWDSTTSLAERDFEAFTFTLYVHGSVKVRSVVERGRSQFWLEAEFPKTECSALVHQDAGANSSQKGEKTKGGGRRWRRKGERGEEEGGE